MVDDDTVLEDLLDLLDVIRIKGACALEMCRVSAELHRWWVDIVHLDDPPHTCPGCFWKKGYPRRTVALTTVYGSDRTALVDDLTNWLNHLHTQAVPIASGRSESSAPGADATASAPTGSSSDSSGSDGPASGYRVGSAPSDYSIS